MADWLVQLFKTDSVAHTMLIISIVTAIGLAFGSIRVRGISLGITGVLFAGLLFGHFKITVNEQVLEFIREFGLILFVYATGLQVGPGFFDSMRRYGLTLNMLTVAVVVLSVPATIAICHFAKIDMPTTLGLFSGAITNTPSLAAAQQALIDIGTSSADAIDMPGLGYAVAYPFSILGVIFTLIMLKFIFRVNPKKEAQLLRENQEKELPHVAIMNIEVQNPNLVGMKIKKIPGLHASGVVISRIRQDNKVEIAQPDTMLKLGDVLLAVGDEEKLNEICIIVGAKSPLSIENEPSNITTRRLVVTRKNVLGKSFNELNLRRKYGVVITRVSRSGIEFVPSSNVRLHFADTVLAVGEPGALDRVAGELGNSLKQLNYPQLIPIFVGIALGVLLGSIPFKIPGVPFSIKLGLAGGPLLVSILLSYTGHIGSLVWYMPLSATFLLREFGIALFFACIGLKSGDQFVEILVHHGGFSWIWYALLICVVPLLLVAIFARLALKMNFAVLCGLIAGSYGNSAALMFANNLMGSEDSYAAYATVYPISIILPVIAVQIMATFFLPH